MIPSHRGTKKDAALSRGVLPFLLTFRLATEGAVSTAATATTTGTAVTTTATAKAATAATTAETAGAGLFRTGFVHDDRASFNFLPVQSRNRRLSFLIGAHLDESEPLGAAGLAVHNDFRALDLAVRREQLLAAVARQAVTQVSDIQFLTPLPYSSS